jgi:hypothetical protein
LSLAQVELPWPMIRPPVVEVVRTQAVIERVFEFGCGLGQTT